MTAEKNEGSVNETFSFSEELLQLQEVVKDLEADEISLEDSLKHYESGVKIVARAKEILEKAEQEVRVLENSMKSAAEDHDEDETFP